MQQHPKEKLGNAYFGCRLQAPIEFTGYFYPAPWYQLLLYIQLGINDQDSG